MSAKVLLFSSSNWSWGRPMQQRSPPLLLPVQQGSHRFAFPLLGFGTLKYSGCSGNKCHYRWADTRFQNITFSISQHDIYGPKFHLLSLKLWRKRISKAANPSWCLHFWMPRLRYFKSTSILKKCQNSTTADNQAPFRHLHLCNRKQRQPKPSLIYEDLGFGLLTAYITFENWTQTLLKIFPIKKTCS